MSEDLLTIRAALATLLIAVLGCRPGDEPPRRNVIEQLAAGVFLEYGRPVALGRPIDQGDHPDVSSWTPLPISAGDGWLRPARGGWSPIGDRAVLTYHEWAESPEQPTMLRLDLRHRGGATERQRIEVRMAGQPIGSTDVAAGFNRYLFPLPHGPLPRSLDIELVFDPPVERARSGGQALTLVGFGLASEPSIHEQAGFGASPTLDDSGNLLRFSRSGRLVSPLSLGAAIAALEIEWRCSANIGRLEIAQLDDARRERVAARLEGCPHSWLRETVPLGITTDSAVVLSLDVQLEGEGSLEIRRAVAIARRAEPPEVRRVAGAPGSDSVTPSGEALTRPSRPDILLIILDAARAGHFGFAGYPRDTTPHLDRFASESLVFERAYSECPNTACSIPNLITGVPFQNVGTVFTGKKIPDELTTLAEYLEPLGYRTVGFSSNPNNSISRNSHQGFDRFRRLWGAHNQAELAREEIARQPTGEPLFLQLHLLPPHEPYMPRAEFDLFTDPDYRGPVHPKMGLRRYNKGLATLSATDVEQLLALYDGNLRMADDAVRTVFEAMRSAGRWEDALVLVTSDHGEAFGEHGEFQHNSTLFDEMLHVPFVLRLPQGEQPENVVTDSRVSLSDVVPTILGYLGQPPRPEVWGLDLLSADADLLASRVLFHRTLQRRRPLLGIRAPRFVALTGRNLRWPLLFDLVEDAEQRVDLAAARPAAFSGLTLRLRDFIAHSELRVPRQSEDVELSPEEVELLRSLGYVQ